MTIGDSRCDVCGSHEKAPYIGDVADRRVCLCRKCIGKACQSFLRYIRGFDRDHPPIKRPRNPNKPIIDPQGTIRCRGCQTALEAYRPGASPLCGPCMEAEALRRSRPELTQGSADSSTNPARHEPIDGSTRSPFRRRSHSRAACLTRADCLGRERN